MKLTIRYGTFETNSSSTHAIVIDRSGAQVSGVDARWDGVVRLRDFDLDGSNVLRSVGDRISYLWSLANSKLDEYELHDLEEDIAKVCAHHGYNDVVFEHADQNYMFYACNAYRMNSAFYDMTYDLDAFLFGKRSCFIAAWDGYLECNDDLPDISVTNYDSDDYNRLRDELAERVLGGDASTLDVEVGD